MKKLFLILSVALFSLGTVNAFAQEAEAAAAPATEEATVAEETPVAEDVVAAETEIAGESMHHILMQKFLEGGWIWMLPILLCLVFGLAVAIERILFLSLSTINSKKLIAAVEEALKKGGIEAAKDVWTATTRVSTPLRSRLYRTVRYRRARWSRVCRGLACSSPFRLCWDSWVRLSA